MKILNSIQNKILAQFAAFLLLLLGIFVASTVIVQKQKNDGLLINLAGRQRMLTQKMTKEILIFTTENNEKNKEQILSTVTIFEKTLLALKNGGEAPLDLQMTEFRRCPPAQSEEIERQLAQVISLWQPFKRNIQSLLDAPEGY
ncbi:MAG: type IV pili methyl-accepting chemotaxis transducer N-terminal domain-containing protein [Candidatus Aureabacteria bacterium]|nr:type IV pili methyl-accepting chemotaxis transducer N-terminal domain-containing protein [Candidatus Auribacterota bacterium]